MIETSTYGSTDVLRQYSVWLITILLVAFGFKYAKEIIAFVLDKFYQFFIDNNMLNVK